MNQVLIHSSVGHLHVSGAFQETHLTVDDSPRPRDFVVAADPVVDGLGRLGQVDLQGAE